MVFFFFVQILIGYSDPDQTPQNSAASDQSLHFLHMSHKKDARLIWVNPFQTLPAAYCMEPALT